MAVRVTIPSTLNTASVFEYPKATGWTVDKGSNTVHVLDGTKEIATIFGVVAVELK